METVAPTQAETRRLATVDVLSRRSVEEVSLTSVFTTTLWLACAAR